MSNINHECSRCILDTSDYPEMEFDEQGVCNICLTFDNLYKQTVFKGEAGKLKLQSLLEQIKKQGKGNDYDCILGVSGGVDSSYLAYLAKEWGLRPLILHVDNGWNSELAVQNIEQILKILDFDLYTHVIKWSEMKDYQLAFLKSSVVDIDLPFDNTFVAILYKLARKHNIKYILSGHNTETEGWLPPNFTHYKLDSINLKAIHKKFGVLKLKEFEIIGPIKNWIYNSVYGIKMVSPLNYIDYNKAEVKEILIDKLKWRDYGGKHFENIFTRFYQGYILPTKFNVNKTKAHLSTLICSGQLTRNQAKQIYKDDDYINSAMAKDDKEFFVKKMGLTNSEFEEIMHKPICNHTDYPSYISIIDKLIKIKRRLKNK